MYRIIILGSLIFSMFACADKKQEVEQHQNSDESSKPFNLEGTWNRFYKYDFDNQVTTHDEDYRFNGDKTGQIEEKVISTINGKTDNSTVVVYDINWNTGNKGTENYFLLNYKDGHIKKIIAEDTVEREQALSILINHYTSKTKPDTIFFKNNDNNTLSCYWTDSTKSFIMKRK